MSGYILELVHWAASCLLFLASCFMTYEIVSYGLKNRSKKTEKTSQGSKVYTIGDVK